MTPEQQRALALANARRRAAAGQQQPERGIGQRLYDNIIGDPNDGVDSWGERAGRTINDMGASAAAGISRGVTGMMDLPGMIFGGGGGLLFDGMERAGILSPEVAQGGRDAMSAGPAGGGDMFRTAAADATGGATERRGETTAGEYAGTVGEFLPGAAIGGGGLLGNLLKYGVIPGVASEAAGQATEGTAAEPFARVIAPLLASIGVAAATRPARAKAPTADDLAQQADDLYRAGDARPAAGPNEITALRGQIDNELQQLNVVTPTGRVVADGNVKKFLDVLEDFDGQQMTPAQMQTARRFLQDAAGGADPTDRRIGTILLGKFDEWRNNAVPEFQQADELYGRMSRARDVDWRIEKADRRAASSGTGGNSVNTARQNIRQILDNPKARRGYSADEVRAMEAFVRGEGPANLMRMVGRLSPTSGALPLIATLGGMGVAPQIAIPVMGIAAAGKAGAEVLTKTQIGLLSEMIRNGGALPARAASELPQGILAALLGASATSERPQTQQ